MLLTPYSLMPSEVCVLIISGTGSDADEGPGNVSGAEFDWGDGMLCTEKS